MTRIRGAVDNAYALDPRIGIFKARDSEEKLAKKLEKKKAAEDKREQEEKVSSQMLFKPLSSLENK